MIPIDTQKKYPKPTYGTRAKCTEWWAKYGGVYRLRFEDGSEYIGSSCRLASRMSNHRSTQDPHTFEVLLVCSRNALRHYEQKFIEAAKNVRNVQDAMRQPNSRRIRKSSLMSRCKTAGVSYDVVQYRMRQGMSEQEAFVHVTPPRGEQITWAGRTMSVYRWSHLLGMSYQALQYRIRKFGVNATTMSPVRSLVGQRGKNPL